MTCAHSLIAQGVVTNLTLIDVKEQEAKLRGEVLDLQHGVGAAKTPFIKVTGGTDYGVTDDSDIVVITGVQ